jgi:hypothetical protein
MLKEIQLRKLDPMIRRFYITSTIKPILGDIRYFYMKGTKKIYQKKKYIYTVQSLKRVKAITGQKQGNNTIHTVFFIRVRTVMTLLTYCNEENHTNRVVSLLLVHNSFDPF